MCHPNNRFKFHNTNYPHCSTDDESSEMQSINDGKLEVVALYSSFHMAQLQIGLSKPHRIGQANTVKVYVSTILKISLC